MRLEYSGAVYQVVNRGDRREEIFRDDPDRERYACYHRWRIRGLAASDCQATTHRPTLFAPGELIDKMLGAKHWELLHNLACRGFYLGTPIT